MKAEHAVVGIVVVVGLSIGMAARFGHGAIGLATGMLLLAPFALAAVTGGASTSTA